ncbi:MAG: methylisocitrate lyase, partial [Rhabdochlamydiaceae bacterium]
RAAMKAVQDTFSELARGGTQRRLLTKMMTRNEFYKLTNYYAHESLDQKTALEAKRLLLDRV